MLFVSLPLDPERPAPKARVLVVEDDVLVSRAISRVLARLGWEVIAAPSSDESSTRRREFPTVWP